MKHPNQYILLIGCFDTKGEDFTFLYECISARGEKIISIDTGVMVSDVKFRVDYNSEMVAASAGFAIDALRANRDRGDAVKKMAIGASRIIAGLVSDDKIRAAIGMGGGGGTFMVLSAMQEIPLGIPKLCVSTMAGKDLSRQLGVKDVTIMPSVVDLAGLNSISRLTIEQAAAAICAMANVSRTTPENRSLRIAISMFGNTTRCVDRCRSLLKAEGYEVYVFHANGIGGSRMEALIHEGCFDAILDVTTTELADELCQGVCSAGPARLTAAARMNIPQIVVPGCLDMVNFSQPDTVPEKYRDRQLYSWAPDVTLMRTNEEENKLLGELLVNQIVDSSAPVAIMLPLKGLSQLDSEGGVFYQPGINEALFTSVRQAASGKVRVVEVNANINDELFANTIVWELICMMKDRKEI